MSNTINAAVDANTVTAVPTVSFWTKMADSATSCFKGTADYTAPKVQAAVKAVDKGTGVVIDQVVEFAEENPNIAIACSPSTLGRMLAMRAIEKKYGHLTSKGAVKVGGAIL